MNMKTMSQRFLVPTSCIVFFINFFIFSILSHFIFPFPIRETSIPRLQTIFRRGNKHFDVHLRRIKTVLFLSKDGKGASYDWRDGWKSCLFPARVGIICLRCADIWSTFPYLYLDLAGKQLCFPPGKGINRRNESTKEEAFYFFRGVLTIIIQYC